MTKEMIKNFNECAVEIQDSTGKINRGWFVIVDGKYKLFPIDTIWTVYVYTLRSIKYIKHLTNNFEMRRKKND